MKMSAHCNQDVQRQLYQLAIELDSVLPFCIPSPLAKRSAPLLALPAQQFSIDEIEKKLEAMETRLLDFSTYE